MSSLGFYALSMLWLALLVPVVVLFYFLKLKRPRKVISSLVLWQQVMSDNRVNSPFQRFKRNLLLLLQLLLLIAIILAAIQPYRRGVFESARRKPVLIDCSASMAALDKPGGTSRLELAKQKVRDLINGLMPDQELCLIGFSRTAHKLTGFTNNKKELLDALEKVQVEEVPSDMEEALRLTQALARSTAFDQVMIFSDGNFPAKAAFELSFSIDYQKLAPAGPNFGITGLNARRSPDGAWDVFVNVEGSADADGTACVELAADGKLVNRENISLSKGRNQRMILRLSGGEASRLSVRLVPDGFDSLACDNEAFLELPTVRALSVYVPPTLTSFRHALGPLRGIRVLPEEGGAVSQTSFDLVITDRAEDSGLDAGTKLSVGLLPDDLKNLLTVSKGQPAVVDWRRNSPLLQHVMLDDVLLLDEPRWGQGVGESDLENLGYEVLVHGSTGPLLLEKRSSARLSYYMLFHPDRSTFPYRIGFPILVSNVVNEAMYQAGLTEVAAHHTGVLPAIPVMASRTYQVEGPGGKEEDQTSDASGNLMGIAAGRVGYYSIREGGSEAARVGASLLSADETRLTATEEITFNENLAVSATKGQVKTDKPLWTMLALVGFGVLLLEWLYFHRSTGWFAR